MTRIVLISGSLRRGSVNSAAVATVRRMLHERHPSVETPVLEPRTLPFYDQDIDAAGARGTVRTARALVGSADALVISTPSYNGAIPGVLKNALDWLSRPWGASALTGKTVAVLSASPGPRGAGDAQPGLRSVLEISGALLVDHPVVALGHADELATSEDGFSSPTAIAALVGLVDAVLTRVDSADAEWALSSVPA